MKKVLSFLLILVFALAVITGCSGNNNSDDNKTPSGAQKQVPVYQGMSIFSVNTAASTVATISSVWGGTNNGNDKNGDNGNHYGQYKGDHNGKNESIDKENPFPDNSKDENIENEVESSLNVVGSIYDIYYASSNQDIYIYIHIDNPDNYEIMSFTLNGKKYSSYMFEAGSDMETIILKYNVGSNSGIVEYTIDAIKYIDGTEIKDVIIDGDKTVRAGIYSENQVVANVSGINIGTNSFSFDVNIKDNDNLISISDGVAKAVVYDGFSIVSEKDLAIGENSVSFDGLKTNTLYQYAIVGYYDNLTGDGFGMNVLYKDAFYTDSVVLFDNIVIGQESVSFDFIWHEDHQDKVITSLKLYNGDNYVKDVDVNETSISHLLSGVTYKLVAEYLNEGKTESICIEFTTLAKYAPSFVISNENLAINSLSAEYDVSDVDKTLSSYKIEIYKGETLVAENIEKNISFAGLDYYTDYTVKITYTYDLNDGNGEQVAVVEKTYKTLPYIDVVECNIANTSAVSEGETIFMSVKLNNPLGMSIESVVVNGETYNATGASTKNKIFVEIVYNGQFAGGDTYLKIDKVNAKLNNAPFIVEPKSELSDNVFINGKLEVLKIEFVNEDFEPINWAFPSEKIYVMITLNNSTGYSVNSVNGDFDDLIKLDNNHWYFESINLGYSGWHSFTLGNLSYSNDYISKTISYSDMSIQYYLTASNETFYIHNASDLKNMSGGYYYELANDIDLGGIEWNGESFEGVFDGMGYSIKNMSFVGNIKNRDAYLGLFNYGSGVIRNLNIHSATIIADMSTSDEGAYVLYCGGLVAYGNLMNISNCMIDTDSIISISTDNGTVYAGGLIGYIPASCDAFLNNCVNGSTIAVKTSNGESQIYAGGLIGGVNNTGYVLYSNYFINITNCLNIGSVTALCNGISCGSAGAFIGIASMLNDSSKLITNIIGSLNVGRTDYTLIASSFYGNNIINKTYTLYEYDTTIEQGEICTVDQLNSKNFYTETLGWSEDVWDLSELDIENGTYPVLKQN